MMITDQELRLLRIAEALRIQVETDTTGVLHKDDLGGWFPQHKLILIRAGLGHADRLHTLAHELGHAVYSHNGSYHPRQERKADEFAAAMLINRDDYIAAEKHTGGNIRWIAHELGVTVALVEIWRDLIRRNPNYEKDNIYRSWHSAGISGPDSNIVGGDCATHAKRRGMGKRVGQK